MWYYGFKEAKEVFELRKIIFALAFFVLILHTSVYAAHSENDTIKIGLFYGSSAKESVTVKSESGFDLGAETEGGFESDVILDQKEITVTAGEGDTVIIGEHTYDAVQFPSLYPLSGNVVIDGTEYRGGVQFKRINGGKLTVINVVNLEEYLYSVVGKEMSPSWHIEALKAQAVCARGFAISNRNKFEKYGFNLDNTTSSQVYQGVSKERESTIRAVEETKGLVLMYDGGIIESIYGASTGGYTANAENVWGGKYPYLVSVKDIYENPDEATRYSWSVTLTADEIKECLAKSKVNIGDIINVKIVSQDEAGYVCELLFEGTEGNHTVKRSSCRTIFGGKLHSQRYTIAGSEPTFEKLYVLSADGKVSVPSNEIALINGGGNTTVYVLGSSSKKEYTLSQGTTNASGEFTFNGNGWGHGVGMSQWGAKAMADKGFTFEDILTFYYTGTYLENLY